MSKGVEYREERRIDRKGIREVHILAFGGDAEARLVDRLRKDGHFIVSLVAVDGAEVVGHALFSQLPVELGTRRLDTVALAPVAVRPEWQRKGIGSALIRAGIEICRQRGLAAVLVLGAPDYYGRFGFRPELASQLETRYAGPAYMGLELEAGVLSGGGIVRYPRAFEIVE